MICNIIYSMILSKMLKIKVFFMDSLSEKEIKVRAEIFRVYDLIN